ncbi:MAG TPA: polysaccharide deacetylase family protein, partial [Actinoplanes sp.]|nr:polysaccharide deacetylase family protein [Actinoplanes sp.]
LAKHNIRATAALNSEVCDQYPRIVEEGSKLGWEWAAHGPSNSMLFTGMPEDAERPIIDSVIAKIADATGIRPRGWLGPALTETFETPSLLAELGLGYTLDWTNDDQPYELGVPGMLSVPYSIEMNDVTLFVSKSYTGPEFLQAVRDQLDQLYADSADSGRVMALCVHPFSVNQPFRHKYLDQALEYIAGHEGVWLATADEIADAYRAQRGTAVASADEVAR